MSKGGSNSIILSGLAEAGKSTWLAALWQVFEEDGFNSALRLESYGGQQRYIVELNRAWVRCEEIGRTPIESPGTVAVQLRDREQNQVNLEIPDLSGELFREHWSQRHWDTDFDSDIQVADGLLLMVSTLTEATMMLRDLPSVDGEDESEEELPEWEAHRSPAQVQLVEHLQYVALRRGQQRIPVAVMLSAWDQVGEARLKLKPNEWLRQEAPLLNQYLAANAEIFPSAVFGMSAQGGDLEKDRERLLSMPPIERLEVLEGVESSHDLTVPLAWVLNAEQNG